MSKDKKKNNDSLADRLGAIKIRLDAIVLLLLKRGFSDKSGKIKIVEAAPLLYAAGYSPSEIAKLFGKTKATQVAPYIYSKKR